MKRGTPRKKDDLDLYAAPRLGSLLRKPSARGVLGGILVVSLVTAAAGYSWMTRSDPVSADQAVEAFREENDSIADSGGEADRSRDPEIDNGKTRRRRSQDGKGEGSNDRTRPSGDRPGSPSKAGHDRNDKKAPTAPSRSGAPRRLRPREGVYSWATEGWEQAGGARRSFPEESQRILTHEGSTGWMQHHYYSEERETWTRFRKLDAGSGIAMQRNKITFGPVTNDSAIRFSPPMLAGPRQLEIGQEWSGTWSGDTSGSYRGRVFEQVTIEIDGDRVKTFGIHIRMTMRGEIEGEAESRVWLAPEHAMTVREEYKHNVEADISSYRAEWSMTLKSLEPRR